MKRLLLWLGLLAGALAVHALLGLWLTGLPLWLATAVTLLPFALLARRLEATPYRQQLRALSSMIAGWRDSDFALSISAPDSPELDHLTRELNAVGTLLRRERHSLVQRELLLQTVIQSSPMAVMLCDSDGHIVLANVKARQWFGRQGQLEGHTLAEASSALPPSLQSALEKDGESMCTLGQEPDLDTFHVSRTRFELNGQAHYLILVRPMTRELNRREAAVWKKVIRLMSHEINNSLAPISSLAHSGRTLANQHGVPSLDRVFDTIESRARHLNDFIAGYARFAKLPPPQPEAVDLRSFLTPLCGALDCQLDMPAAGQHGWFDPAQLEQVLINLVKNALEAGSESGDISVHWLSDPAGDVLEVRDRGQGMAADSMERALLPFYSTKRSGSGLGLALAREIMEAHEGYIDIRPREGGGTVVSLCFERANPDNASAINR
ncbi:ATP-binding protein [Parahaliea maris]|uniref:histidine kinase n=1 Tax=Parahaliea maris TaxID=2716870 RepID=A0A5C9A218_9GAMM|nr:ATP-binding protein [Parahaliea maris]TXS94109.1 ATP-binding protein [Parahaliea maris]